MSGLKSLGPLPFFILPAPHSYANWMFFFLTGQHQVSLALSLPVSYPGLFFPNVQMFPSFSFLFSFFLPSLKDGLLPVLGRVIVSLPTPAHFVCLQSASEMVPSLV